MSEVAVSRGGGVTGGGVTRGGVTGGGVKPYWFTFIAALVCAVACLGLLSLLMVTYEQEWSNAYDLRTLVDQAEREIAQERKSGQRPAALVHKQAGSRGVVLVAESGPRVALQLRDCLVSLREHAGEAPLAVELWLADELQWHAVCELMPEARGAELMTKSATPRVSSGPVARSVAEGRWLTVRLWTQEFNLKDVRTARAEAVLASRFQHVLVLQPQNLVLGAVMTLFDEPSYTQAGAVFWPDLLHADESVVYEYGGLRFCGFALAPSEALAAVGLGRVIDPGVSGGALPQIEPNQWMVDTHKHDAALKLYRTVCRQPDVTFSLMAGDKDVLHMAWRVTASSFHWVHPGPYLGGHMEPGEVFVGRCYVQHHPRTGEPLFAHAVEDTDSVVGTERAQDLKKRWRAQEQPLTHVQRMHGPYTQLVKRLDASQLPYSRGATHQASSRGWTLSDSHGARAQPEPIEAIATLSEPWSLLSSVPQVRPQTVTVGSE